MTANSVSVASTLIGDSTVGFCTTLPAPTDGHSGGVRLTLRMDSPENASDKLNTSNSTESVSDKHNGSNSAPANLATDSSSDANQFHSPVKTKDDVVLSDDSPVKEKDDDSFVKQKDDPAASDVTSASASDSTKTADSQKKSDRSSNNKIRKEDLVYAQNLGRGSYSKVWIIFLSATSPSARQHV